MASCIEPNESLTLPSAEVWTDGSPFARALIPELMSDQILDASEPFPSATTRSGVLGRFFETHPARYRYPGLRVPDINAVVAVDYAQTSQFDQMIELLRTGSSLPHGLICAAGASERFHGYRGRGWRALRGNLHLSVHWAPRKVLPGYGAGLLSLGALACADAVDELVGKPGTAGIKWVNDVIVGRDKIAGVLAWGQTEGTRLDSIVLGIGLNVEITPTGVRDEAVERATAVSALTAGVGLGDAFSVLVRHLSDGYRMFISGNMASMVARYRARSVALGRKVRWVPDGDPVGEQVEGRAVHVADDLALVIEGRAEPLRSGRIAFL